MNNDNKDYISNKDFTAEIIKCKAANRLTPRSVEMFEMLVDRVSKKLSYRDPRDKQDCTQSALHDLCKYWRNFDPDKSMNAFAFFTSIAVHGLAKEFNRIHKCKLDLISLDLMGDQEIYTI